MKIRVIYLFGETFITFASKFVSVILLRFSAFILLVIVFVILFYFIFLHNFLYLNFIIKSFRNCVLSLVSPSLIQYSCIIHFKRFQDSKSFHFSYFHSLLLQSLYHKVNVIKIAQHRNLYLFRINFCLSKNHIDF